MRQGILVGLIIAGVWLYESIRPVPQPAGVIAEDPPVIKIVESEKPKVYERRGYVLSVVASFEARARVVARERSGGDRESEIASVHLALSWGRLSDSKVLKNVDIALSKRKLFSKSFDPQIPDAEVESNVFVVHASGADAEIDKKLAALRVGSLVKLDGFLVEARGADGWRWIGEARKLAPRAPGNVLWVSNIETIEAANPAPAK
jgi:hypothetical protein